MITRWSLAALAPNPPDVIIVGTDPVLSVLVARFWKLIRPKTRIVHWCFDLYPEAAIVDGVIKEGGVFHRLLRWLLRPAIALAISSLTSALACGSGSPSTFLTRSFAH